MHVLAAKELWAFTEEAPGDPRLEEIYFLLAELETSRKQWKRVANALSFLVKGGGARATASAYRLAEVQETLGELKGARDHYLLYLALGGKFNKAHTHWRLAFIERELKDHARAAKEFATFLNVSEKSDNRRIFAWEELVAELVGAGQKKNGLDSILSAVEAPEVKNSAEVLRRLATTGVVLAAELGEPSREAALLQVLAANAPDATAARVYTARRVLVLERAGEGKAALALADDYLEDAHTGNAAGDAAGETAGGIGDDDALEVLLAAARLEEEKGNFSAALAHLSAALGMDVLPQTDRRRTEIGLNVFALALNTGKNKIATAQAQELLAADGHLSATRLGTLNSYLGSRAEAAGDRDAALKHYLAVPKESSRRAPALKAAVRIKLEDGQAKSAKPLVDELLLLDASDDDTRALALALSESLGDSTRSVNLLREELAVLKGGDRAALLLERLAGHLQKLGDSEGEQGALRELAERYPHLREGQVAAFALMRKAFDEKKWQRTIDLESVAEGADRDGARYMAAEALVESGRGAEAVARLALLAENGGAYAGPAHVRLAAIDESLGKMESALLHYEAAVQDKLNNSLRTFVEQRIAAIEGASTSSSPMAQDKVKNEETPGE
jgi:hypothetical protein